MPLGSDRKPKKPRTQLGEIRRAKAGVKRQSYKQEKDLAHYLGGRTTALSGATPTDKGDVTISDFTIEAKRTEGFSYKIEARVLAKLVQEAQQRGHSPVLSIELQTPPGVPNQWCAVPLEHFRAYLEAYVFKSEYMDALQSPNSDMENHVKTSKPVEDSSQKGKTSVGKNSSSGSRKTLSTNRRARRDATR